MKLTSKISSEEAKWRAESDARILSEAYDIQSDASRMAAAKKAALNIIKATQSKYSFASGGKTNRKKK